MDKHFLTPLFSPNSIAVFIGKADDPSGQTAQAQALHQAIRAQRFTGTLVFLDIHFSGAQGNSQSVSVQRVRERLVLPSQIAELPDLHAYLALAGHEPTRQVQLRPVVLPAVAHAIDE